MEQPIIAPIDKAILKEELANKATLLRHSRKGGTDIYIFNGNECPNLMREVGRLREIVFREAGGGTGLECDVDHYDYMEKPYMQLIVWEPKEEAILGGYRYIYGPDIRFDQKGQPILATSHMYTKRDSLSLPPVICIITLTSSFASISPI